MSKRMSKNTLKLRAELIFDKILVIVTKKIKHNGSTFLSELDLLGKHFLGKRYLGTFPKDKRPKRIKNNQGYIFNLDESNQPGSHWVAVYKDDKGKKFLFDSFGRSLKQMKIKGVELDTTDPDLDQKVSENDCGQRSLAWLILADRFGNKYAKFI